MKIPNLFAYYQKDEYIMNRKNINTLRTVELFAGVGGFPCQDYSVASTLKNSHGIVGKKGVLWWEIYRILEEKKEKAPKYLMLENVDRLLKSPASQRGRDFAIILASLNQLDYAVVAIQNIVFG